MILYIILFCVVLLVIKFYLMTIKGVCTCKNRLDGKTVLLTGGNSGIGYYTALNLAKRGCRLIITSENEKDLIRARDEIILISGNKNVIAKYLDLTSLDIIRSFVKDIYNTEEKLDILINNAGSFAFGNNYSKDGLLLGLQVNYFGPFLLTILLIDLLKKSKSARIVNVASILSQFSVLDLNDINKCPGVFSDTLVYSNSKLFVVYMTWELAARLEGTGITVNCLHPGVVNTGIFYKKRRISWQAILAKVFGRIYFKTPEDGAQTSIHLAVSDKIANITGYYFQDCKPARPVIRKDLNNIRSVWDKTIELVKLKPEEIKF